MNEMALSNFDKVGQFMRAFEQEVKTRAEFPSEAIRELRFNLIDEELTELRCGMQNENLVEIADALTDILYVVYGAGHAYGINLDRCFQEVHRSNMTKLGEDGKPIRREDGKALKGPNYEPPKLEPIVLDYCDIHAQDDRKCFAYGESNLVEDTFSVTNDDGIVDVIPLSQYPNDDDSPIWVRMCHYVVNLLR